MKRESLADGHRWLRICGADWEDPLDDTFAQARGGRWNPPGSWRTLYLNEDVVTARINIDRFIGRWPYEPEDLRADARPHLAVVRLPRNQDVADAHTPDGVDALGLPASYPEDATGALVPHGTCQHIGEQVRAAGLRGVRCRSAQAPHGAGRELAWFPATSRSRARLVERLPFADWFWA